MLPRYAPFREPVRPSMRKAGSESDLTVTVMLDEYKLHRKRCFEATLL